MGHGKHTAEGVRRTLEEEDADAYSASAGVFSEEEDSRPRSRKAHILGIVAIVASLVGLAIPGLVCGIASVRCACQFGYIGTRSAKTLGIIGIAISVVMLLAQCVFVFLGYLSIEQMQARYDSALSAIS